MKSKRGATAAGAGPPQEGHERFNLATMSGVFPGTRTQIYQRVQIAQQGQRFWLQLLWYTEPVRVVAYRLAAAADTPTAEPFLEVPLVAVQAFNEQLQETLQRADCTLRCCGSCTFWQPTASVSPDQLTVGRCRWVEPEREGEADNALPLPAVLSGQSHLAPACRHWQLTPGDQAPAATAADSFPGAPVTPMRRAAEDAEIRHSVARRLQRRLRRWWSLQQRRATDGAPGASTDWQAALVERSGVGAGTEPCLVCQGRIANLGALTAATEDDDKQTFSVWRCRSCYALYLNNWIDRWERLDNLETEESYYRLAPAEANRLLALIHAYEGGEHPSGRHQRTAARTIFLDFIRDRIPLSYQIRQGR